MKSIFTETQERLRSSAYKNEEHVRLSLVARIVQALGWDIWNPAEVNTEFIAIPHEDKTRVDMALFLPPWKIPSIFIEIKAVGKMLPNLSEIEKQTRDYNRNNTALISIITDGQLWKFYLSQTGGEFSQKRFLDLDLLKNGQNIDELESEFRKFLSSNAIESGDAIQQAVHYLKRSRKVKAMEEVYLDAIEASKRDPATTLASHLVQLIADRGEQIIFEEAVGFIKNRNEQPKEIEPPPLTSPPSSIFDDFLPPRHESSRHQRTLAGRANSPDPSFWVENIEELKNIPNLNTWKAICGHLHITIDGDSARRRLSKWVKNNRPNWPQVPEAMG